MSEKVVRMAAQLCVHRLELVSKIGGVAESIAQELHEAMNEVDVLLTPTEFDAVLELTTKKIEGRFKLKKR